MKISKQILTVFCVGLLITSFSNTWAQSQRGILIFPFTVNDKTAQPLLKKMISDMLFSRLSTNPCMIVKDYRSMKRLEMPESLDINQSKKIAQVNGLTHILTGSVSIFGGQYSIDAQIWDLNDQKPGASHSVVASSEKDVIPRINEISLSIRNDICKNAPTTKNIEAQKEQIGSFTYDVFPELDIAISAINVADVNQDNHLELIAADRHNVYIFAFSDESLNLISHFNADHARRIVWLDAADIDHDQKPEIYVTALHKLGGHLVSFVLIWENEKLKVAFSDEPYFFRCFQRFDQTVHLIGQKQTLEDFFAKKICVLKHFNNRLIVEKMQFIPPKSHFASFHQGRFLGPGKSYVVVRENNKMEILDASFRPKWKSESYFAESKTKMILSKKSLHKSQFENDQFMYLNQRILVDDVDHDTIDEIIVSQQNASSGSRLFQKYRQFVSGTITCLKWNGLGMIPLWKTPKVNGYISDYFWFDKTGQGNMCIVLAAVSSKSFFKSATTQILLFEYHP